MTENEDIAARRQAAGPAEPKKRKKKRSGEQELQSRVAALLDAFEQQVKDQTLKVSVSDYIRLLQLKREFEEKKPRDIEVTWVDSLREKNDSAK